MRARAAIADEGSAAKGGAPEINAWGVIQLHERWFELVAAYSGWIPLDPSTTPFAASMP